RPGVRHRGLLHAPRGGRRPPAGAAAAGGDRPVSGWLPVNDCRGACADGPVPRVDPATRRRRELRLTRTLAATVRRAAAAPHNPRRRQRALVRSAAEVLT